MRDVTLAGSSEGTERKEKLSSDVVTRKGIPNVSANAEVTVSHPVQVIESNAPKSEFRLKLQTLERVYGKHAAMRLRTETELLGQVRRLPGLRSEFAGLNVLFDGYSDIDVADVFDDPHLRPDTRNVDPHLVNEARYAM